MTPEQFLSSEQEQCPRCSEPKPDVKERVNLYAQARSYNSSEEECTERMCSDCAHQLYMDS